MERSRFAAPRGRSAPPRETDGGSGISPCRSAIDTAPSPLPQPFTRDSSQDLRGSRMGRSARGPGEMAGPHPPGSREIANGARALERAAAAALAAPQRMHVFRSDTGSSWCAAHTLQRHVGGVTWMAAARGRRGRGGGVEGEGKGGGRAVSLATAAAASLAAARTHPPPAPPPELLPPPPPRELVVCGDTAVVVADAVKRRGAGVPLIQLLAPCANIGSHSVTPKPP